MDLSSKCFLSFIVPVFNVEKHVEACLLSLLDQNISHKLYEIIVIDDMSPDNSIKLVEKIALQYNNLRIVKHNKNRKQGSARNTGLKIAKGEYVWFVDSDDYLEPNCLKAIVDVLVNNDLDVLHFDYNKLENNEIIPYESNYKTKVLSGSDFLKDKNEIWWKKGIEVWRRIHKKSFLLDNDLMFAENVMYEDADYSIELMSKVEKLLHINASPYIYRSNEESITLIKKTEHHFYYWVLLCIRLNKLINKIDNLFFTNIIEELIGYQLSLSINIFHKFSLSKKMKVRKICKTLDVTDIEKFMISKKWRFYKQFIFS